MRVIVTGAASGIGAAVARGLIAGRVMPGPHQVLLVDRDVEGLARMTAELGQAATSMVARGAPTMMPALLARPSMPPMAATAFVAMA